MTRPILFKNGTIVTMDTNVPDLATGDVLVDGDRIAAIAPALPAGDAEIIDATGCIVLPGLVDAHHHAWLSPLRRLMPDVDDLFAYIGVVAETLGRHYRPRDMYLSTHLTAIASLDAGITTIVEPGPHGRGPRRARRERHPRAAHGRPGDGQGRIFRPPAGRPGTPRVHVERR
jgi:cytosine/adenosine deaminase-related metal-dependent hydrolase